MSDDMDPFVWTEPTPLPDPTLVDFFTSSLPESPPDLQLSPDTPSNATHPWESEMATLQEQNAALQGKLADVPKLLEQLDRQKSELAAAHRRLVVVETDRARLQDRFDRLERTAKRPRVDNLRCSCGKKRERASGLSEWLDQFALVDVADVVPEVRSFVAVLEEEKREQTVEKVASAVYNCVLHADEERSMRILRCIAAAARMECSTIPALVDGILSEVMGALQKGTGNPLSTKDVVRVLLQGAAADVWTKRTAAEVLASFIAQRREAGDLLRVVISSNEKVVEETLIENTDGRDLNLLWGRSLQAVVKYFASASAGEGGAESSEDGLLSRWNDVRTTVEDLQDHASLRDAETAVLLEWSMSTTEVCFEVAVRKALLEKMGGTAGQMEKMERMLGLVTTLMGVLRREETEDMRKCVSTVAKWLIGLSLKEGVAPRLAATAVKMALEMVSGRGQEEEDAQREFGEDERKAVCEKVSALLRQRESKEGGEDDGMQVCDGSQESD